MMEYAYIFRGQIYIFPFLLDERYRISKDLSEQMDHYIPLSQKQLSYYKKHPNATIAEVFTMRELNHVEDVSIDSVRSKKIEEIRSYDQSNHVNSFSVNNISMWIDKGTRLGLLNSIAIEQEHGKQKTILWYNAIPIEVPCDMAIVLLKQLELYALECFNTTAKHISIVRSLSTIEEIENYDHTLNYPEKLNFKL